MGRIQAPSVTAVAMVRFVLSVTLTRSFTPSKLNACPITPAAYVAPFVSVPGSNRSNPSPSRRPATGSRGSTIVVGRVGEQRAVADRDRVVRRGDLGGREGAAVEVHLVRPLVEVDSPELRFADVIAPVDGRYSDRQRRGTGAVHFVT